MSKSLQEKLLRERIENLVWVQNFLLDVIVEWEEGAQNNNVSKMLNEDLVQELEIRRQLTKVPYTKSRE